jgi:hypothetical protein
MWAYRRVSDEKGVVLVVALLIMAILLLMTVTLSYNISSFLSIYKTTKEKTQTYYTTVAGIEQLRDQLWNTNCAPPDWCGNLLAATATDGAYQNRTGLVADPQIGGYSRTIYFKDNEDGDGTYASDSDQIVLVSIESQNPGTTTKTTVEAMFIFAGGDDYMQQGKSASKANHATGQGAGKAAQRQTF